MTSSTHIPHHLVVGDHSLDTATYASFAHGLIYDPMYHRGDAKTTMPPGKHTVRANHISDAASNNLLFLVLP